jgi:polysaccharide export outer membrane protein
MVNERGEVSLTKLGVVQVSRFTITELQDTLRVRYSRYLRDPGIDIVLLRRVSVNGEVAKPNVYYVDVATMLRDVIAKAGGITESGDHKKVTIVRDGERLRVRNWEQDQTPATDLQSGDEVIVERRNWFALNALPVAGTAIALVTLLATLRR